MSGDAERLVFLPCFKHPYSSHHTVFFKITPPPPSRTALLSPAPRCKLCYAASSKLSSLASVPLFVLQRSTFLLWPWSLKSGDRNFTKCLLWRFHDNVNTDTHAQTICAAKILRGAITHKFTTTTAKINPRNALGPLMEPSPHKIRRIKKLPYLPKFEQYIGIWLVPP
jgi:hypothetical protein